MNHINYQKGNIIPPVIIIIVGIMLIGSFWLVKARHALTPTASPTPTPSVQLSASIQPSPSASPENSAASSYKWGTFSGTMPCGDCSGITTTLELSSSGPGIDMGAYIMTLVYQGKSVTPFISEGVWTVNRGMPGNPNATVVVLDETGSNQEHPQYFLRVGEDKLQMLDADQKPLPVSLPSTLTRITGPQVSTPAELDAKTATTKIQLIGTWQDSTDPHYQTEFKADGTQIDSYNGEEQTSTTSQWALFTSISNEPTTFQLNNNDVYLKQTTGKTVAYFRIAQLTATNLQLVNMDKGGVLQFKRIK